MSRWRILGGVKRLLHAAKKHHRYQPRGRVPLWITEFWWESNPPDKTLGIPVKKQARWIEQALYLFWRAGAPVALNLQVTDSLLPRPDPEAVTYQTGIFCCDGPRKPSYTAFTFPFVGNRSSKRKVRVWGKAPNSGRLKVQVRRSIGAGATPVPSPGRPRAPTRARLRGHWRTVSEFVSPRQRCSA